MSEREFVTQAQIKQAQICNAEDYEPFMFTDPPKGWGSWLLEDVIPEEVEEVEEIVEKPRTSRTYNGWSFNRPSMPLTSDHQHKPDQPLIDNHPEE